MKTDWDAEHQFTVEGRGQFPFDMLRHSRCWPTDSGDANRMGRTDKRRITLTVTRFRDLVPARWESFNWTIVDGLDEYGFPAELAGVSRAAEIDARASGGVG